MNRIVVAITLTLACVGMTAQIVNAQQREREVEKLRQMDEVRQSDQKNWARIQLDSAITLTEAGMYQAADIKYLWLLKNMKALPSDLTFYFGKNSYFLEKYSQGIDWLNKYIQLKGPSGQYYDQAVEWLRKSEQAQLALREQQSKEANVILSRNYEIDCGPTGKVVCPVCNGSTVVIKRTYLGESYKTCTVCKKKGYLLCEEFNQLLRGEFKANP